MRSFIHEQEGATSIEYALIASIVSVVCIACLTYLGQKMSSEFSSVGTAVSSN